MPHTNPNRAGLDLDDHQTEALQEIYEGMLLNRRKMCAVASCGSGKTLVEIAAVSASQAAKEELGINGGRKDIILTEGRGVVAGIRRQFDALGIETGIWSGGKKELEPPIIVAGVHALQMAIKRKKLHQALPEGAIDLCVVDEVDRFLTEPRGKIIDALNPRITAGFTATEAWPDGRHISDRFGPVVHRLPLVEAMEKGVNVVPDLCLYQAEILESDLKLRKDDYDPAILQAAWKHAELHLSIPEVYRHLIPQHRRKECPTLVYVPSRELVHTSVATLQSQLEDVSVAGLTGDDTTHAVHTAMNAFLDGELQILVLCEIGGRGMNLENAKFLIDAYPTKSLNKLEQRHGRVLRKIRPGSTLHKKGWRKKGAIIAQIIPKAGQYRPALFTDIVGGWQELQRVRGAVEREEGGGAIEGDLIAEVRQRIELKKPPLHLQLVERIDTLEGLQRDLHEIGEDGFFRIPKRYVQKIYGQVNE